MNRLERGGDDDETVDRLSELPDSLSFEIISLLETRDLVATISLLSKRWRVWKDVWTTIPYLYFNFKDNGENLGRIQINFINEVLQRWNGTKILRFKIYVRNTNLYESKDMARWVGFAVEKKVEDLDLDLSYFYIRNHEPPECLFSCSSITKLRLSGFRFQPERGINVQWDRLKRLEIDCHHGGGMNEELLHQFLSSAPQLQILDVSYIKCHGSLSIQSSSLKKLSLSTLIDARGDDDPSTFTLWAPNLEQLTMSIEGTTMHLLFDVPALTDVTLKPLRKSYFYNGTLKQLFQAIQHVKALTLQLDDYKKLFGVFTKGECLFSNVKILKLIGCPTDSNDVVGLDEFFPNVEKLITDWNWYSIWDLEEVYLLDSEANTLLPQLREVEVIWCWWNDSDLIIKFIKFVLKFGIMVQKIVIKQDQSPVLESERLELQSLRSSFPTAEIILC